MKTTKRTIWENYPLEIRRDFKIPDEHGYSYDAYACEHLKDGTLKVVVIGKNEGGYNSVGMCGECLAELLRELV